VACTSCGGADKTFITLSCLQYLTHKLLHCVTCEYKNRNSFHVFELKTIVLVTTVVSKFRLSNTQGGKEGNTDRNNFILEQFLALNQRFVRSDVISGIYTSNIIEYDKHIVFFVFFLVSLCLKANAEMVPKIPSCHYMLLI